MTIYTDAQGRPFDQPEPPARDASIEDKIAYLRARAAWSDAITDCANTAFDKQLKRSMSDEVNDG